MQKTLAAKFSSSLLLYGNKLTPSNSKLNKATDSTFLLQVTIINLNNNNCILYIFDNTQIVYEETELLW